VTGAARIAFVVAVAENGIIGRNGALPWQLPSDLKRFRKLTLGKPMIMGRKTYASIGRPLDGRDTIVVTRAQDFSAPGVHVAQSIEEAIALGRALAAKRGADEVAVTRGPAPSLNGIERPFPARARGARRNPSGSRATRAAFSGFCSRCRRA